MIGFTCFSDGFQIVIKPSFLWVFLWLLLLVSPTTLTLMNGLTSLPRNPASANAFSIDFSMSDCLIA